MPKVPISTPKTFLSWGLTPPAKYFLSDRMIVMICSVHPIWTGNGSNRDDRSQQAKTNLIICYKRDQSVHLLETVILVLQCLYQWPISELGRHHPALDCVSHSDVTYTYTQRDIFAWTEIYWKDYYWLQIYSCNKFGYRIINDNTFFKERNIAKNDNDPLSLSAYGLKAPV